jgi:hypothetical protein
MKQYGKRDSESGVVAYEIGLDSITIEFKSGNVYLYSYASTGKATVETMKQLATKGSGLSTYISKHVNHDYAVRLK